MYSTVRIYRDATQMADALMGRTDEIQQVLAKVNGFVSYTLARTQDGMVSTTTCQDRAGTAESTRIVADWVQANLSNIAITTPEVLTGETIFTFSAEYART
jgi:hypothetical protein